MAYIFCFKCGPFELQDKVEHDDSILMLVGNNHPILSPLLKLNHHPLCHLVITLWIWHCLSHFQMLLRPDRYVRASSSMRILLDSLFRVLTSSCWLDRWWSLVDIPKQIWALLCMIACRLRMALTTFFVAETSRSWETDLHTLYLSILIGVWLALI